MYILRIDSEKIVDGGFIPSYMTAKPAHNISLHNTQTASGIYSFLIIFVFFFLAFFFSFVRSFSLCAFYLLLFEHRLKDLSDNGPPEWKRISIRVEFKK